MQGKHSSWLLAISLPRSCPDICLHWGACTLQAVTQPICKFDTAPAPVCASTMQTAAEVSVLEPMHELASPTAAPARRSSCKQIAKAGSMGGEAVDGSGADAAAAAAAAAPTTAEAAAEPQAAVEAVVAAPAQPAPHPVVPPQRREVLLEGFTSPEVTHSLLSHNAGNLISGSLVTISASN